MKRCANNAVNVPSRARLNDSIRPRLNKKASGITHNAVAMEDALCVSFDLWISSSVQEFSTVFAYFFGRFNGLTSCHISLVRMHETYLQSVKTQLEQIVRNCKIHERCAGYVCDGGFSLSACRDTVTRVV